MLLCCNPKLNWMPKNPTFMLRIWAKESCGLVGVMAAVGESYFRGA
jgi:hypothetical protein